MCSGKSRGSRNEINRTRDETGETWRGRERAKPKAEAIRRSFRFFSPPPLFVFFSFFYFLSFLPRRSTVCSLWYSVRRPREEAAGNRAYGIREWLND